MIKYNDPLIDIIFNNVVAEAEKEPKRKYIGASSIGDRCYRRLWLQFYKPETAAPAPATLTLAANDGHRSELIMAGYLQAIPGIDLKTHKADGTQYGFSDHGGYFKGHFDGIISGLPEIPRTTCIWEHKSKNHRLYDELTKLKDKNPIGEVLRMWDYTYYCQAVIYMHYAELSTHYMTVSAAGMRNFQSVITYANPEFAEGLIQKAARIIDMESPPIGISQTPSWWECKMCKFNKECFKNER